jgi:hypothetical protein
LPTAPVGRASSATAQWLISDQAGQLAELSRASDHTTNTHGTAKNMRKDDQLSARRRGDQHVPSGSLSALEKAGIEAALNRCRALAQQIEGDLRVRRSERFADLVSLAELQAALERAAWVLERKSRQSVQTGEPKA